MIKGDLIEIKWLDACFFLESDENQEQVQADGGVVLYTVGFIVELNDNGVTVVGELDADREPHRDFNTIPRGMILEITLLKSNTDGWVDLSSLSDDSSDI